MKRVLLLLVLALCIIYVSGPAWGGGLIGQGDLVYNGEDPKPPKD